MNMRPLSMTALLLWSGLATGCRNDPAAEPEVPEVTDEAGTCASPRGTDLPECPRLCDARAQGEPPAAGADLSRDIRSTALNVKLDSLEATALIQVAGSSSDTLSLKVGSLRITGVSGRCGPLKYTVKDGQLDVGLPGWASSVRVDYVLQQSPDFDGYLPSGTSFIWPSFCGNLYPCHPALADGATFSLQLENVPAGKKAIYAESIPGDAPPYMLAWAVGDYTEKDLGRTTAGTQVAVWYLPGEEAATTEGTRHLKDAVDFYERRYGAYTFGGKVGSVSANWGAGAYGGMEHHPYWHVAADAMGDRLVHHHEAAHGWYGNGVRIQCWEDFVLSEGTSEYLTARAVRETEGEAAEAQVWSDWRTSLERAVSRGDTLALPDGTCNEIDILTHPLWSSIPYKKGAFFYRALEKQIGTAAMDQVLARFYQRHVGGAARMQQLLDLVKEETRFDPTPLANAWLRQLGIPAETP
ncbi:M1 family metallopeptidase [Archangium primigenium]|uniref:M1 family metallopeptidase n=1 Tax=[Archangium] primigenium TaxID=2792470 RepID=UPI00195A860A|nr:M1 family aminopeptidase [Archangium primigenium]MBM7116705.1 peptidase M1 [Archangium primigenium]